MLSYDPDNFTVIPGTAFLERCKEPKVSPSYLSGRSLRVRMKRMWCRWMHDAFMNPRNGKAICGKCLEHWEVGV